VVVLDPDEPADRRGSRRRVRTGPRDDLVSVPLRENLTVHIANLPLDLSQQEARRIAGVIEALARPEGKTGGA